MDGWDGVVAPEFIAERQGPQSVGGGLERLDGQVIAAKFRVGGPRPHASLATTPGASVAVGSVAFATGTPGASTFGTVTAGRSRVRPVTLC